VAFYKDTKCSIKSSSGGLFVALAKSILAKQGIVYGAAMVYDNHVLECRHIRVEDEKDLYLLQGSKYVQSRMSGIYTQVKKDLTSGKTVLFSGTSCQVASMRNFVGAQERLFTVDLVCHGVPQDKIYNDYIDFIEKNMMVV
jgi:coenzyme F420-reducing hydrogenase beta subunit